MRLIIAFVVAILVPACIGTGLYLYGQFVTFESNDPYILIRTRTFLFACLALATLHVVFLGIPGYFVLRRRNALRWWSILSSGFVLGAIPSAVLSWPLQYAGMRTSSVMDGVAMMNNGVPTIAGWLSYLGAVAVLGAYGVSGAAAFWLVQHRNGVVP
jgi:hypothetical protein